MPQNEYLNPSYIKEEPETEMIFGNDNLILDSNNIYIKEEDMSENGDLLSAGQVSENYITSPNKIFQANIENEDPKEVETAMSANVFPCNICEKVFHAHSDMKKHKLCEHGFRNKSRMDVELLISEVFTHRAIWCAKEPKHNDRVYINKVWDAIGLKLNVTADAAKRKFKSLRDQFRAELKKVPFGKSGDRSLPMEEYLSHWQYFQMLFFLRDDILGRKPAENLTSIKEQESFPVNAECSYAQEFSADSLSLMSEANIALSGISSPVDSSVPISSPIEQNSSCSFSQNNVQSSTSPSHSQTPNPSDEAHSHSHTLMGSVTKKAKIKSAQEELLEIEKEKMAWMKTGVENDNDPEKHYVLSLLPQLKSLPPIKLNEIKLKIYQLLHEALYEDTN